MGKRTAAIRKPRLYYVMLAVMTFAFLVVICGAA
jgi:hypothetical protein